MVKYDLSDDQLRGIANLCYQEQGSVDGAAAEASLASNLLQTHSYYSSQYGNDIYTFMRKGRWFSRAAHWMDNGSATPRVVEKIRDVLVNGNHTLPLFVDEHDCFSDITSATNYGAAINKKDRSAYIRDVTKIKNRYGSAYTFYCFPTPGSDPFGYTDDNADLRKKGDDMAKGITICGHGEARPRTTEMNKYCQKRYDSIADNGRHKGVVCVKRLKAMTTAGRRIFHDAYGTILGRNYYSQDIREYVFTPYKDGRYYSDCSSSGCAAMQKAGYTQVPLLNTAGIYYSPLFEEVPVKISKGIIQNPEILKVGDALLFVGNDPSRPLQIGHVEYVWEIDGTVPIDTETSQYYTFLPATVRKGDSNTSVLLLQEILKARGIYSGDLDRSFGTATLDAVMEYQRRRKSVLGTPDGIVGPKTWADLIGFADVDGSVTLRNVAYQSTGLVVLLLQEVLKARGFYGGDLDRDCGPLTVTAINAYQALRRVEGTELGTNGKNDGVCGPKMWADLIAI